ncbi:hypothetical protein [Demequina sp.]|uniref:hypothetical protein n=1 Tax=Demequina sp. TaxID=2050685 RepID=UPI003A8BB987
MRLAATAATTALSAVFLAGCSAEDLGGAVGQIAKDAAQQAVEDATGGDVSVNFGDGANLPADWPATVPAPEGELAAAAVTGTGWTVAASGSSLEMTDYVAALTDAGFVEDNSVSVSDAVGGERYSDGTHVVDVAWAAQPGGDSGFLTVVVAPEGA